jgi:hypothetical protein
MVERRIGGDNGRRKAQGAIQRGRSLRKIAQFGASADFLPERIRDGSDGFFIEGVGELEFCQ